GAGGLYHGGRNLPCVRFFQGRNSLRAYAHGRAFKNFGDERDEGRRSRDARLCAAHAAHFASQRSGEIARLRSALDVHLPVTDDETFTRHSRTIPPIKSPLREGSPGRNAAPRRGS